MPEDTEAPRIPETITREQFVRWLKGCASEIVAGGCLASDPLSRSYNQATFRAKNIVDSYAQGRGLFQVGDLE